MHCWSAIQRRRQSADSPGSSRVGEGGLDAPTEVDTAAGDVEGLRDNEGGRETQDGARGLRVGGGAECAIPSDAHLVRVEEWGGGGEGTPTRGDEVGALVHEG